MAGGKGRGDYQDADDYHGAVRDAEATPNATPDNGCHGETEKLEREDPAESAVGDRHFSPDGSHEGGDTRGRHGETGKGEKDSGYGEFLSGGGHGYRFLLVPTVKNYIVEA